MILVTGGAGFVGSHLADRLDMMSAVDVRRADRKTGCDLSSLDNAHGAMRDVSQVYHLAADMGGIGYITKDHAGIATANTRIDLNVLEAARVAGVKRFYYASSACAYPVAIQGRNAPPLQEDCASSIYAEAGYGLEKRYMEEMCRYYSEDYGLSVRITRFMNVYGDDATTDPARSKALMALCLKVAHADDGDEIEIWGDGSQVRDFVHVDDVVEVIVRLMASDYQKPINVGTGRGVTIRELAEMIAKVAGKRIRFRFNPDKPVGVHTRVANISTMVGVTGYVPQVRLEDGIARTYEWVARKITSPVL